MDGCAGVRAARKEEEWTREKCKCIKETVLAHTPRLPQETDFLSHAMLSLRPLTARPARVTTRTPPHRLPPPRAAPATDAADPGKRESEFGESRQRSDPTRSLLSIQPLTPQLSLQPPPTPPPGTPAWPPWPPSTCLLPTRRMPSASRSGGRGPRTGGGVKTRRCPTRPRLPPPWPS